MHCMNTALMLIWVDKPQMISGIEVFLKNLRDNGLKLFRLVWLGQIAVYIAELADQAVGSVTKCCCDDNRDEFCLFVLLDNIQKLPPAHARHTLRADLPAGARRSGTSARW